MNSKYNIHLIAYILIHQNSFTVLFIAKVNVEIRVQISVLNILHI